MYQIVGDSVQLTTSDASVNTQAIPTEYGGRKARWVRLAVSDDDQGLFSTDPGDAAAPTASQMAIITAGAPEIICVGGSDNIYLARIGAVDVTFSVTPVQARL